MMTRRLWLTTLLIGCLYTTGSDAQYFGPGVCPDQWEVNGDSCYLFVFHPPSTYSEAASACWAMGSALVSINNQQEYGYIRDFLNSHGQEGNTVWYTSGQALGSFIKWNGDGTFTNNTNDDSYWVLPAYNTLNVPGIRIIYSFSERYRRFAWSKTSGYDPYNYICEIPKAEARRIVQQDRDFWFGNSNLTADKIPKGPHFTTTPFNEVIVDKIIPLNMECFADGYPQPTYRWFISSPRADNNFEDTYRELLPNMDPRYTFANGRLNIDTPEEGTDAGTYQCRAENAQGSIRSRPILVSFGYLNQFSPNQQGFVQAKLMQGSYINCMSPSAKPALSYQWYKDDIRNFIRPELNKYFFISSNGNLYFSEVQDTDRGEYFCVVTLIARVGEKLTSSQSVSRTSRPIELRVSGNPALEYGPIIHPDFIAVFPKPPLVNNEVRMECFAYGKLPLMYSWYRDNGRDFPPGTRFDYDNRVLIIPNPKFEDGGNYTCKVVKFTGQQSIAEKSIYLTLESRPYFVHPLKNVHADEGSELTWRCEARAVPRATYTWYKDSQQIGNVPGVREIRTNVMKINRLEVARDAGMYQCGATNAHGTTMTSAQLRVLSIKPNFNRFPLPATMFGAVGGNLTIPCKPEAAPQPEIAWSLNGANIGYGDGRRSILEDGTLHVTEVTQGDQGRYTCKATNTQGEAETSTMVSVMRGVEFQTRPPQYSSGQVNTTVFLFCEATYDSHRYDLTYVWKFNGRIIDLTNSFFFKLGERNNIHGLYIRNAQYYHTGMYECIAQTVMVHISSIAYVEIKGPPAQPAGVLLESKRSSQNDTARVMWTWNPVADHGYPVMFFDIQMMSSYSNVWEWAATDVPAHLTVLPNYEMRHFYDVTNLLPYNSYVFRVIAKNEKGVGPPSKPSGSFHVNMAPPRRAPSNVGGGGGSFGVLTITWSPMKPEEEGGTGFGYHVFWKKQGEREWLTDTVGRVTKHVVTLTKDDYFLLYDVKVQAYNGKGDGPMSDPTSIYSAEGMPPIRPTNVKFLPVNGTALNITWDPLPNTREAIKGRIIGYQINYINVKDCNSTGRDACRNQGANWTHSSNNQNRRFIHCNACSSGLIIGLKPNERYWVNVAVVNSAGVGIPSEGYKVITYEFPPGRFPLFVQVLPHGTHSALVKWRGVNIVQGEATLDGYRLQYWPVGDDIRTSNSTFVDKGTEGVIYGLQNDIIYKLRVNGVNRGGDGMKSPTVFFTVTKAGSININRATFDPTTSQFVLAAAATNKINIIMSVLCAIGFFVSKQ